MAGWGAGRSQYPVSFEDIVVLLQGGAVPVVKNQDNGDGTFLNVVEFDAVTFVTSSNATI